MNTKIIGFTDKLFNNLSKTGRFKNNIYKKLEKSGMNEIRERVVSKDSFVILASKEAGIGKSDITIGYNANKGSFQKKTLLKRVFGKCYTKGQKYEKIFYDLQGNIKKQVNILRRYMGEKTLFNEKTMQYNFGENNLDYNKIKTSTNGNSYSRNISGVTYRFNR